MSLICSIEIQKIIFEGFHKLEKKLRYQVLSCGITLTDKKSTRLGRSKYRIHHNRLITASYCTQIENENKTICQKCFKMCME